MDLLMMSVQPVSIQTRRWSIGIVLVLGALWSGACTGARQQEALEAAAPTPGRQLGWQEMRHFSTYRSLPLRPEHYFDESEADLEHGQPEPASRYNRPRGVQHYRHDETEADLAARRPAATTANQPSDTPVAPGIQPAVPAPRGDQ